MKIMIDLDDTIANSMPEFCRLVNERQFPQPGKHAHQWSVEDFTRWDVSYITGFSPETCREMFGDADYDKIYPFDGAIETVQKLSMHHNVSIVTANPRVNDLREWLDTNGLAQVPLSFSSDKAFSLKEHGYDALIDDNPDTLEAAVEAGYWAVRFERPWNASLSSWGHNTLERSVNDWGDVWRFFDQLVGTRVSRAIKLHGEEFKMTGMYDEILEPVSPKDAATLYGNDLLPGQKHTGPMGTTTMPESFDTANSDTITNKRGGKQTDLKARFDLLPPLAVAEVAAVLERGAKKYGEANWHLLNVEEIHNHTLGHAIAFNRTNSITDLAHTATRALMALEIALREQQAEPGLRGP